MTYAAEVLAHSVGPLGRKVQEVVSFRVKCPAMVVQQLARHRTISMPDFSLSVSSMRAIPLAKQIQAVLDDPAMPVEWGAKNSGMAAVEEIGPKYQEAAIRLWKDFAGGACCNAEDLGKLGLHKQIASRVLAPYSHYEMVLTSCWPGLANFFSLRCHQAADPTIRRLAVRMADAFRWSSPRKFGPGWWHLPYVTMDEQDSLHRSFRWGEIPIDQDDWYLKKLINFSVARCARVSFLRHGLDHSDPAKDIEAHDRFLAEGAWSVFEHQCRVPYPDEDIGRLQGNLPGWVQYRQLLTPNVHTDFDFAVLDQFKGDL